MRHAKSSWKDSTLGDHERPLNKRGRRDAPRVGARLTELGWVPERVISSTSQRTRETWAGLETTLEPTPEVTFRRELYLAGRGSVKEVLEELPAAVTSVLVLGHNYGWEEVVEWLCGDEVRLTTANAALLSAEGDDWAEALAIAPSWTLHQVIRPKELPG